MERKQSKFDLLDQLMSRLGVTPSMLTKEWLQSNTVPFVWIPRESSQKERGIGIIGEIVSAKLSVDNVAKTSPDSGVSKIKQKNGGKSPKILLDEDVSLFYNQDWNEIDDEFKLSSNTSSHLRCGMIAYLHGSKIVITKKAFSSQKEKNQNYTRLGIVFDLRDNLLLTLSFCIPKSSYSRVSKKLDADCRLPTDEECEKIFVYKELLHRGFSRLKVDLNATQLVFCENSHSEEGKIGIFDFQEGNLTSCLADKIVADAYQVKMTKLK